MNDARLAGAQNRTSKSCATRMASSAGEPRTPNDASPAGLAVLPRAGTAGIAGSNVGEENPQHGDVAVTGPPAVFVSAATYGVSA